MSTDIKALRRTNTVLTAGTWLLITGVVFYSLMTTTPFVAQHSAWSWSGPALGLMTDVAFVMALQAESVLSRHGATAADLGGWPRAFRWFTGLATVFLNIWASVAKGDPVGVAVHLIAPALLMLVAEVAPVYRRLMAEIIARHETGVSTSTETVSTLTPAPAAVGHEPQVGSVDTMVSTSTETPPLVDTPAPVRLDTEAARRVIEDGWRAGLSARETSSAATRHASYVARVYRELDATRGPRPVAGQLSLVKP